MTVWEFLQDSPLPEMLSDPSFAFDGLYMMLTEAALSVGVLDGDTYNENWNAPVLHGLVGQALVYMVPFILIALSFFAYKKIRTLIRKG